MAEKTGEREKQRMATLKKEGELRGRYRMYLFRLDSMSQLFRECIAGDRRAFSREMSLTYEKKFLALCESSLLRSTAVDGLCVLISCLSPTVAKHSRLVAWSLCHLAVDGEKLLEVSAFFLEAKLVVTVFTYRHQRKPQLCSTV